MKISLIIAICIFEAMLISAIADGVPEFPSSIKNIQQTKLKSLLRTGNKEELISNIAARISLSFIENRGQIDNSSVRYYMAAPGKKHLFH
jgi:hypothetical protein